MRNVGLLMVFIATAVLVACSSEEIETNMSETVPDFEFTTQDNDSLSLSDLEGDYWVADFVFTNCTTICLPMTSNMSVLQDKIKDEDLDNVQLVSFTVDPEYDSPDVLKEYAEEYDADLSSWTFLTGFDFDTIKEFSIKSFRNLVQEPESGSDQVMHGTRFYLVDPDGNIIKNYDGVKTEEMDVIVEDLKKLVN